MKNQEPDERVTEQPESGRNGAGSSRPASIVDVARAAGVSVPTVSRVLTGAANVSPQRRDRVLSAIEELEYRPSETARALVRGRSRTVAVLTSETTIYGYSATIHGIELAARDAGLSVAIAVIDDETPAAARRAVDSALRQSLAGVIVLKFDAAGAAALTALPKWLPVVAASGPRDPSIAQASLDERSGGHEATRYLLGLGHDTVHHVAIPPGEAQNSRTSGWRAALVDAGRTVPPLIIASWDARSGVAIGRELARRSDVTAVFCGNDEIAMGLMAGLLDSGARVPDDVSVVGFDDHPLSGIWRPALTTVAQDFDDLGRRAFALLAQQMGGDLSPGASTARARLIVRASTASPTARR